MLRWRDAYKTELDGLPRLSINMLNQVDLLNCYNRGDFNLKNGAVVDVETLLPGINQVNGINHMARLRYKTFNDIEGEKDIVCEIKLETTPCRFGGLRYWFICPGLECGRRVGVLYRKYGVFACRLCHQLSYASQNENKRMAFLFPGVKNQNKIDELEKKIKRRYYNGKPTRLQRKFERLINLPY